MRILTQFYDMFIHFLNGQMEYLPQIHLSKLAGHLFGEYPCSNS